MAIKIHKKSEEEKKIQALDPEVLPPDGSGEEDSEQTQPGLGNIEAKAPEMNDKFMMRSRNVMEWLLEHRRMVMLVVGSVLAVAVIYISIMRHTESVATEQSSELLSDTLVSYTAPTEELARKINEERERYLKSQGIAAEADSALKFKITVPDDHIRMVGIQQFLKQSLETNKYEGTAVEKTGYLMLAGATARLKPAAESEAVYQHASGSESADVDLFAKLGMAEMLVGQQKYDEAMALYDKIAAENAAFTSYSRFEKARLYEIKGSVQDAITQYDLILRESGDVSAKSRATAHLRLLTPDWASHVPAQAPEQPQTPLPQADM